VATRRVPHVQDVAVVADAAIVRGRAAWLLARVLAHNIPGGIGSLLLRVGASPADRDAALRAYAALEHAGELWHAQVGASASGTAATGTTPADLRSERWLTTTEVALLLERSPRRVRQLARAGTLPALLDAGVWWFERANVLAYRERPHGTEEHAA
jgi:Helix-turn-helix domain